MGVGSVAGAPIVSSNEGHRGATFRKPIEGATSDEMYALIKVKLAKLNTGSAKLTLDDATKSGVAEAMGARVRMTAEDGCLVVVVEKYPPLLSRQLNERVRAILEKAPGEVAEARAAENAKAGWVAK